MGRTRTKDKHLPRRMQLKHGAYYHVARQVWTRLSDDYGTALQEWAKLEGRAARFGTTVADGIAIYLADNQARLKAATLEGYSWSAKALIKVFGPVALADVERQHVYQYLKAKGNVSANRDRALLSAVFNHMINIGGHKGENPAAGLNYRNAEKARERYITDAELDRLAAESSPRFATLIRFAYATGMRQKDLIELKLTAATPLGIEYIDSKTGKRRVVAWSEDLTTLWRKAAGSRIGAQTLFLTRDGTPYTASGIRASWRHVKVRAGLADLHFHDIRRKSGSDADDETHAQKLLGHADPKVTRKHYRAKPEQISPINSRQKPK